MDNQPTQPGGTSPETPTNSGPTTPATPTTPTTPATTETPTPPTGLPATDDVVLEPSKKHHKKGLIAAIIAIVAVLLVGGGAFAAAFIINNQPANIIASSLNNLVNANQVEVDGSINLALQDSEVIGVKSFSLNFDDKANGLSNTTVATLNVNFANGASAPAIEFGEVMLSDGVLYIEANGLKDFYDEAFRDNIKSTLMEQALYGYQTTTVDCYSVDNDEYAGCLEESYSTVNVDPATEAAASDAIDQILDQIGKIIESIDGQWIEISIDDVLNNEMLASIDSTTRETISSSYKCTINTLNQMPNYSNEFSDLYSQNPFINMTAGDNSFYNISFDATNLANYLNTMPNTKFASDLAACYNTTLSNDTVNVTSENINSALEYLPQISAKFDGIFNHHLTELKMFEQNDSYNLDTDLKFSYPNNIIVNAPSDSLPVMDVINQVYQDMEVLQTLYTL